MADADLKFTNQDGLKWFASSADAKRGFCKNCGSSLFWKSKDSQATSVCAGTIDGKTELKLGGHIYVASAGDYYEITGGSYQKW